MPSAVHISLNVSDLSKSVDFYRGFFGEPKKLKADYAKFVSDDAGDPSGPSAGPRADGVTAARSPTSAFASNRATR